MMMIFYRLDWTGLLCPRTLLSNDWFAEQEMNSQLAPLSNFPVSPAELTLISTIHVSFSPINSQKFCCRKSQNFCVFLFSEWDTPEGKNEEQL